MEHGFAIWANPSSPHGEGRKAKAALEDARDRVKRALGWDGELIFTSGASEALAIGLSRAKVDRRIASAVEHDAVFRAAPDAELVPVANGEVDGEALAAALAAPGRAVVVVQHVNSETGTILSPFVEDVVAAKVREAGGLLLRDCAQSAGKVALPEADMLVVSAHKFGGPIGIGALLVKDFAMLHPMGGQERGYRRGTENLPGALGLAAALEACGDPYLDPDVLAPLDDLAAEARALGGTWLSDRLSDPTPYIRAIAMPGLSGSAQLMRFDMAGIAVSQGSACSSGSLRTSHVLEAMGLDADTASRTIRVSFGWNTTRAEVGRFCDAWLAMAREAAERAA